MTTQGEAGETPQQITPVGSITHWMRTTWTREPSEEEHAAIDELIPQGGTEFAEYVVRFSFLIVLSASIAWRAPRSTTDGRPSIWSGTIRRSVRH